MNNNKKIILYSILIFLFLIVIGVIIYGTLKPKTFKEITFSEYQELFEGNDKFVLFIGSNECSHCTLFKNKVNRVVEKYGITINYIDVSKLSDKQYAHLNAYFPFSGTPTTIVIQNGEEVDRVKTRIDGDLAYDTVIEKLKNAKVIK